MKKITLQDILNLLDSEAYLEINVLNEEVWISGPNNFSSELIGEYLDYIVVNYYDQTSDPKKRFEHCIKIDILKGI